MSEECRLHVVSHTHWDREWYLSFQQFRLRLVDLMDNLVALLDEDPDFRYFMLDGQTICLFDYLEIRDRRQKLTELISSGRVLVGPWYVQNDETLTSGEATIRNLLIGFRDSQKFGADPMLVGYVPDQFGHISQLPQIFNGFGIKSAVLGRGYDIGKHQSALFNWESPDGSSVLGVFMPTWYNNAQRIPEDPKAAAKLIAQIKDNLRRYLPRDIYLLMNGVDHLEAQENLTEALRGLRTKLPPDCEIIHSTLPAYIDEVTKDLPEIPKVTGELRAGGPRHILDGTLAARIYLKLANDRIQNALERWIEPISSWLELAQAPGADQEFLDYTWRFLLQNHAHDSICGCSIDRVHQDMMSRYAQLDDICSDYLKRQFAKVHSLVDKSDLQQQDSLVCVYNPTPWPQSGVVSIDLDFAAEDHVRAFELVDPAGSPVPFVLKEKVRLRRRILSPINLPGVIEVDRYKVEFRAAEVPANGYKAYTVKPLHGPAASRRMSGARREESVKCDGILENEHLRIEIQENGSLVVHDKETGVSHKGILTFEDEGDAGNAYFYAVPEKDRLFSTRTNRARVSLLDRNDLLTRYQVELDFEVPVGLDESLRERLPRLKTCPLQYELTLGKNSRVLQVDLVVDNQAKDHRLSLLVPTAVKTGYAEAGGQFDVLRRPATEPSPRTSGHHPFTGYVAVSDNQYGLAFMAQGLHDYRLVADDAGALLKITLLRAVRSFADPGSDCEENVTDQAQTLGKHSFRFGLYFYPGDRATAEVGIIANQFNTGLKAQCYPVDMKRWSGGRPFIQSTDIPGIFYRPDPLAELPRLPREMSFWSIKQEGPQTILCSAQKPQADERNSLIIRLWNESAAPADCRIALPDGVGDVWLTDLNEQRQEKLPAEDGHLDLHFRAKEIITLEWELRKAR